MDTRKLLKRMKLKILSDDDINFLVNESQKVCSPEMISIMKQSDFNPERTVRLSFLSSKCTERRKELGWDISSVAKKIGVPLYRIKAIESGHYSEFSQKEVLLYVKVLGIKNWFERWRKVNHHTFNAILGEPDHSTPWAKRVRGTNA